jgi:hypothetical protein
LPISQLNIRYCVYLLSITSLVFIHLCFQIHLFAKLLLQSYLVQRNSGIGTGYFGQLVSRTVVYNEGMTKQNALAFCEEGIKRDKPCERDSGGVYGIYWHPPSFPPCTSQHRSSLSLSKTSFQSKAVCNFSKLVNTYTTHNHPKENVVFFHPESLSHLFSCTSSTHSFLPRPQR